MSANRRSTAELLSALGIIGSLIFVGLEIRQSNAWARQEALQSMTETWVSTNVPWALDERFSSLAARQDAGTPAAEFTPDERQSLVIMHLTVDQAWQFRYRQLQVGILRDEDFRFPVPQNNWFNSNFHRDVWPRIRGSLDDEFASFWEDRFGLGDG